MIKRRAVIMTPNKGKYLTHCDCGEPLELHYEKERIRFYVCPNCRDIKAGLKPEPPQNTQGELFI